MRRFARALVAGTLAACGGPPEAELDPGEAAVDRVRFEGAEAIAADRLLEILRPDLERYAARPDPWILDDAAFRLERAYRDEGRLEARARIRREDDVLHVRIEEGPPTVIGDVLFEGAEAFDALELRGYLETRWPAGRRPLTAALLRTAVDALTDAYGAAGHLEAQVELEVRPSEPGRADLRIRIREGPRYRLAPIEGLPDEPELREALASREGAPATPLTAAQVEALIVDFYAENGRPFAEARTEARLDREEGRMRLRAEVDPGPPARIRRVRVQGETRTHEDFLVNRADLTAGEPARSSRLRRAEQRLLDTGLFRRASISPGPFFQETGELDVDLRVEEHDPGSASLRAGWGSLDGIRGGADVRYHNLLGRAELISLSGTASPNVLAADAELAFPFFRGTELRPSLAAFYEQDHYPSFRADHRGGAVSAGLPLSDTVHAGLGYRVARVNTRSVEEGVPAGELRFLQPAIFATLAWEATDQPVYPTLGARVAARAEWAGGFIADEVEYVKLSGRSSFYVPLPFDVVLAAGLEGGWARPLGGTELMPIALRYFAGGSGSTRGFRWGSLGPEVDGHPVGGEAFLALQLEGRFPIWRELHGAIFTDRGGVWFRNDQVALDDMRYSAGLGLRYYSSGGPFLGDVAWNPDRRSGERAVSFHFSVGFPF